MNNNNSIDFYLRKIIKESVQKTRRSNLFEQEEAAGGDSAESESEKMKKGSVAFEDIVEKLNSIRAGKSLRDEVISKNFEEYFEDLSTAEKTALFAYLKAISQILSGEVEAEKAQDPGEDPASVEMKKLKGGIQKKTIKPNVIKLPEKEKQEKGKSSKEDTTGPVPIKPRK